MLKKKTTIEINLSPYNVLAKEKGVKRKKREIKRSNKIPLSHQLAQ
jgi:hypothetical protein